MLSNHINYCKGFNQLVLFMRYNLHQISLQSMPYLLKCTEQHTNNHSLTQVSQFYVHASFCLKAIRSLLNLATGGHWKCVLRGPLTLRFIVRQSVGFLHESFFTLNRLATSHHSAYCVWLRLDPIVYIALIRAFFTLSWDVSF